MPAYSTPGVYVNEAPLTSLVQSASGISSAAFFGEAERGPTTPTLISSWADYKNNFGELKDQYELGFAVYHYFTNGGRACYVSRVVAAAAVTANSLEADSEGVLWTPAGGAAVSAFDVTAKSPGTWGNSLTVAAVQGNIAGNGTTTFPSFHVVVKLGGVEVERWLDCSIDPNDNRYVENVVNQLSSFIVVSNVNPAGDSPDPADAFPGTAAALDDGADGTVADSDFVTSFDGLDTIKGNLLLNAPGQVSTTVVAGLVAKAGARGDSFVIIDPDKDDTTFAEIQATAANFSSASPPSYCAAYAPALKMVDPSKSGASAVRTTAPGGAIAGMFVRTEVARTVAKAPAGFSATIRGAIAPSVRLSDEQVGTLYNDTVPVNSFRTVPGAGISVHGARTFAKTDPDKFIPVRRTLNYLKYSLKELTAFAPFEPNDERLWSKLSQTVTSFLGNFWRANGLRGQTSREAFYVVCDETNNTAGTIDSGEVHIEVGVSLLSPAEFIVINLTQWTGGASSATES